MKISIISKKPPGGRCTLYGAYAQVVADALDGDIETVFPGPEDEIQPPALLVDGKMLSPADGVILSPFDVYEGLGENGSPSLLEKLEAVEERFMEACGK